MRSNAIIAALNLPNPFTLGVLLVFFFTMWVFSRYSIRRFDNWRVKTYGLYDFIEKGLGGRFIYDRTRKLADLLSIGELSPNILRIKQAGGMLRAMIIPRSFWIGAAEIRLHLRVFEVGNRSTRYFLTTESRLGAAIDDEVWYVAAAADPQHRQPLTEKILREIMH
jgi:hypothetical protein